MKKTFSIFNFQPLLTFHTIWPTFDMEKNLFNFQLPTIVYISHNLTYTWHGGTQTPPPPPLPIANQTMHQTLFSTHLKRGGLLLWKRVMHFLKTLVLTSSKNLSLFYKYNSLGLGYSYSFQKMQFQGLDSSLIFLISWTFGPDTSRPNLEP